MESIYSTSISKDDEEKFQQELIALNNQYEDFTTKATNMINALDNIDINHGISYIDSKNLMLSLYMKNLLKFCKNKLYGQYDEGLIRKLINLKVTQEKMKAIDTKVESQISKYQRIAEGEQEKNIYKPDLDFEDEEDEEEKTQKKTEKSKYKPGKLYFDFMETNDDKNKRRKNIDKAKEKMRNSEYFRELQNELSERPEEIGDDFTKTNLGKYLKEVDKYERDNMTNVFVSKKTLKDLRKQDRQDDDLGNFASELKNLTSIFRDEEKERNFKKSKDDAMAKIKKKFIKEKSKEGKVLNKKREKTE